MTVKKALVVGIENYADGVLCGCRNDAEGMATVLGMPEYGFAVTRLLDDEATQDRLRKELSWLFRDTDVALFYFAGHGLQTDLGTYLVTYDFTVDREGLDLEFLRRFIEVRGDSASLAISILDCCHAGAAQPGQLRGAPLEHSQLWRNLQIASDGRLLLAACRSSEKAIPVADGSNGIFTHFLLKGLLGEAADESGKVTAGALFDYAAGNLAANGAPQPFFRGDMAGMAVLGTGLTPGRMRTTPPDELLRIARQAREHMDEYHARTTVPRAEWRIRGYREAAELLEPVVRWFEKQRMQHTALRDNSDFMAAYDDAIGRLQVLASLYPEIETSKGTVDRLLGHGTFGSVWQITGADHVPIAMKVYHPQDIRIPEKRSRFRRGYEAMKQLDHPYIVKVIGYSECPIAFYMKYIDGPNLRNFHGTLDDASDVLPILMSVAETLHHAHGRGVCHRDVKPENIIMCYDMTTGTWRPFLTDFDLAWFSTATQVTRDAIGTVFYAAPEQLAQPGSAIAHEPAVDVYSFGQLAYYVVTGSDPVPMGRADNQRRLEATLNNWVTEAAARELLDLIRECTSPDPRSRPTAFREISDRLLAAYYEVARSEDRRETLDVTRFLAELRFGLSGLGAGQYADIDGSSTSFESVSHRTRVTVQVLQVVDGLARIEAHLVPLFHSMLTGLTGDDLRRLLNSRVDGVLKQYPNARRRSGRSGQFEAYIDLANVEMSLEGVRRGREVLSRVVDQLEQ